MGDLMKQFKVAACLLLAGASTVVTPAPVLARSATPASAPSLTSATVRDASALKCQNRSIKSRANGRYVSAELGYGTSDSRYGMLRARATGVGPWEKFRICYNGRNYTIQSRHNGKYVSAELGYGTSDSRYGMLRARATSAGTWERFFITSCGTGCVLIEAANLKYVAAELGYGKTDSRYGMLRGRTPDVSYKIGPWEKFSVQ
ncbi:hypothetical protein GCM10023074_00600 [Microbispora amethystogenes]|uniref:DUF1080 domain-containing protein n=2 Tax=Microbispora amethystogenes TaxID=1427754 RepID=A0ABQ4FL15_9ACTN|nr:hypothetical protein Mam01_56800 [Microbispora amethystogenes]